MQKDERNNMLSSVRGGKSLIQLSIWQTNNIFFSSHLGRIAIYVNNGRADHLGQVRGVVSGPAAILGRREPNLRP